ncbi:MAG: penicillin acylase family protein [Pseudomonadota bacterium]
MLTGFAALIVILVALVAVAAGWMWYSLPQLDGTVAVDGPADTIQIQRDAHGVPHIFAATPADAYFGLGFVHAQDRMFQMEQQRMVAQGRLSSVMGSATVRFDRFFRMLDLDGLAKASLERLDPSTIGTLEAYAAGVNAYLATHSGAAAPELDLLLVGDPAPWQPADSVAWLKIMALHLSGNWRAEVLRARMIDLLGPEKADTFFPPHPADGPIVIDEALRAAGLSGTPWTQALLDLLPRPGNGSNNWVVDGTMTASGSPLLANDPHLGHNIPATWYMAHLEAPGLSVVGATLPGVPAIIVGHNRDLAWGVTNTGPDTQDLFLQRVDPDDPDRYITPDGSEPFTLRDETIVVRFGNDEAVTIRGTRHGPVISDIYPDATEGLGEDDQVVALAWTMLSDDDRSIQAALKLHTATSWDDALDAARDYRGPQQNIVLAETSGRIGYYAPAVVPIRKSGDGSVPVPGWSGEYDWVGEIPFEDLPHVVDPPRGYIVTANEKVVGDDYPYFLGNDWQPGYRSQRIRDLLELSPDHTVDTFAAIQADTHSLMAEHFLPFALASEPETTLGQTLRDRLDDWRGDMNEASDQPLIFATWYRELTRLIYADDLGELFRDAWWHRPTFVHAVMSGDLAEWCLDETRDDESAAAACHRLAGQAFDDAAVFLTARCGSDPAAWNWGEAHAAVFRHRLFQYVPVLSGLTEIRVPVGGDRYSVNVGTYIFNNDNAVFETVHGASMRAVMDLADLDNSRFVWVPGQSGHIFSPYYDDMVARWRDNDMVTIPTDRALIDPAHTLLLQPAEAP